MSVARIKMKDYMGEEAANEIEAAFPEICLQMLSKDYALILLCNSATSVLRIAIHKT